MSPQSQNIKTKPKEDLPFDMYIFSLTWAPRFCCTNEKACKKENMHTVTDLYPHGLWPAYTNSTNYPAFCPLLATLSPNLTPRQQHEYLKHGSCSLLTVENYFQQEQSMMRKPNILTIRSLLRDSAGKLVDIQVLQAFGGAKKFAVLTSKQCQLQELTTCWKRNADNTVGDQIDCPGYILHGGRNTGVVHGCSKVYLDTSGGSCSVISKELLVAMKADKSF